MATQEELDQFGVDAKKRALEAAKEKDELAGHIDATREAVEAAKLDLKNQKEDLSVQYLDNSKPYVGGDPDLNTAPGEFPKDGGTEHSHGGDQHP